MVVEFGTQPRSRKAVLVVSYGLKRVQSRYSFSDKRLYGLRACGEVGPGLRSWVAEATSRDAGLRRIYLNVLVRVGVFSVRSRVLIVLTFVDAVDVFA